MNLRRLLIVALLPELYLSLRNLSNPGGPLQSVSLALSLAALPLFETRRAFLPATAGPGPDEAPLR